MALMLSNEKETLFKKKAWMDAELAPSIFCSCCQNKVEDKFFTDSSLLIHSYCSPRLFAHWGKKNQVDPTIVSIARVSRIYPWDKYVFLYSFQSVCKHACVFVCVHDFA